MKLGTLFLGNGEKIVNGKIRSLEFWRFIFTMSVALGHAVSGTLMESGGVLINQGGMAIHFFAVLSGYLLARSSYRYDTKCSVPRATYQYTIKKIKRILPYCWISLAITCFVRIRAFVLYENFSLADVFHWLDGIWPEWLMVNSIFYKVYNANGPSWFFSSVLINGILLFAVAFFFKKINRQKYMYILILIITVWAYKEYYSGNIRYDYLQRVFNGLGIGMICYGICEFLTKFEIVHSKQAKIILSILELGCIIGIIYFMYLKTTTWHISHNCLDLFSAGLICCNALHNTVLCDILDNKVSEWLGSITIGIYFIHSAMVMIFYYEIQKFVWNSQIKMWFIMLVSIIGAGILLKKIVTQINWFEKCK